MLNATVLAQVVTTIITFLLFLGILKMFAWGPVLGLLEQRRKRIADEYKQAEQAREDAQRQQAEYEQRLSDIEQEARQKINEAVAEGQRIRDEIQAKAQDESKALLEKQKQLIELEVAKARVELKDDIIRMVIRTTERLIDERLDEKKHRELIGRFIDDVQAHDSRN